MRTVCATFAVVCFGAMIADLVYYSSDHLWTFFFSGLSGIFNYIAASNR